MYHYPNYTHADPIRKHFYTIILIILGLLCNPKYSIIPANEIRSRILTRHLNAKYHYALQVPSDANDANAKPQYYFANNIFMLMLKVLLHKLQHLLNGDGWKD